jgi:HK97 family phage prohead protease
MNKAMEYKGCVSEIKEVDEQGIVTFYAAVFGNTDLGNDIIEQGAFKKTLMENVKNIRHFKHHDSWKMAGVIQEINEDGFGLLVKSKLILKTQLGLETYEEYKAMIAAGKSMDHSIGYRVIKNETERVNDDEVRRIKELKLFEVSTLTAWGMNPLAQTVNVKSLDNIDLNTLLTEQKYFQNLLNCKFTDAKLEQIEQLKKHIDSLVLSRSPKNTPIEPIMLKGSDVIKSINFNL